MEYEGTRLENTDYKLKKLRMSVQQKDGEIAALKTQLEQTILASKEKIEALQKSVAFYKKRYTSKLTPREKPKSETTEESQGVRESVGEDSVSPPIST